MTILEQQQHFCGRRQLITKRNKFETWDTLDLLTDGKKVNFDIAFSKNQI